MTAFGPTIMLPLSLICALLPNGVRSLWQTGSSGTLAWTMEPVTLDGVARALK